MNNNLSNNNNNNSNNNDCTTAEYNDATDAIEGAFYFLCALPADFHTEGYEAEILTKYLQTTGLYRGVCWPPYCKMI